MGQQFCDKRVVLFVIKNYNIQRLVEYKVLELDHIKYHGKCKHFGNGCNWSIHMTYGQKGKFGSITDHIHQCPHRLHKNTPNWTLLLYVPPYFLWCKLIRLFRLKCCRDQWIIGSSSRHRIGKYGLSSKRLLLGFLAIGKSHTMSFQNGCKIFKYLYQVQSSNSQLYHIIWGVLFAIAL